MVISLPSQLGGHPLVDRWGWDRPNKTVTENGFGTYL